MTTWKQPRFFISTFKALPHDAGGLERPYTLEDYRRIVRLTREAGIDLIENAIMSRAEGALAAQACELEGVSYLVQNITGDMGYSGIGDQCHATEEGVAQIVSEQKNNRYLEGYFVWDEMGEQDFPRCREIQDWFAAYDPARLAYSLVVPSYGAYWWEGEGADNWKDSAFARYVRGFVQTVDPPVLSVDYYPFWIHGYDKTDLLNCPIWRDLGLMRSLSLETGKPFWLYFQSHAMSRNGDPLYPFPNVMRLVQMTCALAYGVKCLSYFASIDCVADAKGEKYADYDAVRETNTRIRRLGDRLFDQTSEELYHFGIDPKNREPYFLDDPADSAWIADAPAGAIVGVFGDGSEKKHVLVANKDYRRPLTGELRLRRRCRIDRYAQDTDILCPVADGAASVALHIPAGDAALFILS